MLLAIAKDFARIDDCHVVTCWDSRLGRFPDSRIEAAHVNSPDDEARCFPELAASSDAVLIIAPEFDGILLDRRRQLDELGCRTLGPDCDAIELCGDKLVVALFLTERGIPTVPTREIHSVNGQPDFEFPIVIKPRCGAGSLDTYLIDGEDQLRRVCHVSSQNTNGREMVQQPFIEGTTISISVLIDRKHHRIDLLPIGEQHITDDGQLEYCGGRIPARIDSKPVQRVRDTVRQACERLIGLDGYVGFDLIVPDAGALEPVIIDINPRLTTSYLGYRQLTNENLAARMLGIAGNSEPIRWNDRVVEFRA